MTQPRVKFVSVEDGITALGFRKVAAMARMLNPQTEISFITIGNLYSLTSHLFPTARPALSEQDVEIIAEDLANADLLCFSAMSPSAPWVEKIIAAVRRRNPKVFILWGGTHTILNQEDAIRHADAICTGEGEDPFRQFYGAFVEGRDPSNTPSMWFKRGQTITRNRDRALQSSAELTSFPQLFYDYSCRIYDRKQARFRGFTRADYLRFNGLSYRTVWTIGCPFTCTYCANSAFLGADKLYGRIRYPSVDYLLEEIETGTRLYPFVSTVVFYDDNFIAAPMQTLQTFCQEYKKRIGLPFVAFGLHPNLVSREKIEILADAGLNRMRMGIQSGSAKTLNFFRRNTALNRVKDSANVLAQATRKHGMIPPAYDIISDNPFETREDVIQTLRFLYELERPYTLTVFSLRGFPSTDLWSHWQEYMRGKGDESSYLHTRKSLANIMLYMLGTFKPPRSLFERLLRHVRGFEEKQTYYPVTYFAAKTIYLAARAIDHLRKLDFTTIVGPVGCWLWKMGLIRTRKATTPKQ